MPSQTSRKPVIRAHPAAAETTPVIAPPTIESAPAQAGNVWDRLRSSFAMTDCDANPAVLGWAKRYTHNPKQFENRLRAVMPRLVYVQQVAAQYDVAGEFVLLPWVESHFQPVRARKRRPAGMWQIMPVTAGAMGLRVDADYDGRLDMPAAAHAVMKLLRQYHDQFHDWRVADYAYNAGEFSVRKIIRKHGLPPDQPVIPDWPVRRVTREHLTKLLAMACVVREPGRFNVSLPTLPAEQRLVQMALPGSMPVARAADRAGMSVDALKHLNAAFHSDMLDSKATSYLILPAVHARQFRDALPEQPYAVIGGDRPAQATDETTTLSAGQTLYKTHTVTRGESLWQIARDYSMDVTQLQRLNHLHGHTLKPGQVLQVSATN
jgi:membrane-bound lytic murein transglycosylase D